MQRICSSIRLAQVPTVRYDWVLRTQIVLQIAWISGEWNPVLGVQELRLGIPALLLIIFATWTTNDKNLYSGGLALTNVFPGRSR